MEPCRVPALVASIYRSVDVGWKDLMYVHIGCALILWMATLWRHRLAFHVRFIIILSLGFVVGIGDLLTWGLIGFGIEFFILFCIL